MLCQRLILTVSRRCRQGLDTCETAKLVDLPEQTAIRFMRVYLSKGNLNEFVRGRLKFEQKDENGNFVSRGTGQHDSMIVVFN